MEFKLPFPTLQDLAVLEIAHSLMDLEVSNNSFLANKEKSLRESLSKVDKLEILDEQKRRIREVLQGTSDHLQNWFTSHSSICCLRDGTRPKLQFDVYGCVNEVGMARDFFQYFLQKLSHKCHSEERYDTDLKALKLLLPVASYYSLLTDIQDILQKILKLCSKDSAIPQLEGPEFEIDTEEKLCLVYRFVDQQGIPMSLNVDYFDDIPPSFAAVRGSNTCVRITWNCFFYNSELFQLHWNLLEESQRILLVTKTIIIMSLQNFVHQGVNTLHLLDSESRRSILGRIHDNLDNNQFLRCLLVWPYQVFFPPALQLVRSVKELPYYQLVDLFEIIVSKLDMMAFVEILSAFWEAISSLFKSRYSRFSLDERFQDLLKELSHKNVPMYKRVCADLNLRLTYLQASRKRKREKNSSSRSNV